MNLWAETKCSSAFGDRESYDLVRLLESKIGNENLGKNGCEIWWRSGMRDWWRSGIAETERERDGIAERERDGMSVGVFHWLRETVWVAGDWFWNLHVAKTFHVSGLGNRVKRVLKTRVSIESRVFKTRDAINIYCFKTGQLTILLDTLCYLARGFLGWFIQIIWGRGVFKCVCIIGLCGLCQNLKSSVNNDTRWRRKAHISSDYCPKYY